MTREILSECKNLGKVNSYLQMNTDYNGHTPLVHLTGYFIFEMIILTFCEQGIIPI